MSDTVISGMNGGKYKPYIEQLVKSAQDKGLKPLEKQMDILKLQQSTWFEEQKLIGLLQGSLKRLYGLESIFNERLTTSSDESVVTISPKRGAKPVDLNIKVDQIAAADRFYSDELASDFQVPVGNYIFKVGEQQIALNYNGGSLEDFSQQLSAVNPEFLKANIITNANGRKMLFLESQKTGKDNKLDFLQNARKFGFDIGLITDKFDDFYKVETDNKGLVKDANIDLKLPFKLASGRYFSAKLNENAPTKLKPGAYLEFEYTSDAKKSPIANYPTSTPDKKKALQEGHLTKPADMPMVNLPRVVDQTTIFLRIDGQLVPVTSLPQDQASGQVRIDLGELTGEVDAIVLRNQSTFQDIELNKLILHIPGDVDFRPLHAASHAQDAEFFVDDVRMTRPVNTIDDVSPDVTLTLHGASDKPVKVSLRNNVDEAMQAIQDFVFAYNFHMGKVNVLLATKDDSSKQIIDELAYYDNKQIEDAEKQLGLYQGDMMFRQLKDRLFNIMIMPYPSGINLQDKMLLANAGISTNAGQGAGFSVSSRRGYFEINTNKLKDALTNRWDDVKNLFASVSAQSIIADNGLAVKMDEYLKNFQGSNGIINDRSQTIGRQITVQKKKVDDFNADLEDKKKRWEVEFAKAEEAEMTMKRLQQQLEYSMKSK